MASFACAFWERTKLWVRFSDSKTYLKCFMRIINNIMQVYKKKVNKLKEMKWKLISRKWCSQMSKLCEIYWSKLGQLHQRSKVGLQLQLSRARNYPKKKSAFWKSRNRKRLQHKTIRLKKCKISRNNPKIWTMKIKLRWYQKTRRKFSRPYPTPTRMRSPVIPRPAW